jgi:hypothetical protein
MPTGLHRDSALLMNGGIGGGLLFPGIHKNHSTSIYTISANINIKTF